jgi:hypothetical protein
MRIGGAMFFTDYSMSPTELARALEERGFDSLWVPEHSHIPLTRKSPFPSGGDLPKKYYDVMDPFVVLGAAAAVTKTLLLGTGICLIAQRGRVEMWRGGVRLDISVAASFVWRCLSGSTMAPFPHPAHRTGHADLPHPALGQNFTPSPTTRRAQAQSSVRARSARKGARVDSSRPCDAWFCA